MPVAFDYVGVKNRNIEYSWTPARDRVLKAKWGRERLVDIAAHFECSPAAIGRRARKLGLPQLRAQRGGGCSPGLTPDDRQWTRAEDAQLRSLYPARSAEHASRIMGIPHRSIMQRIKRLGLGKRRKLDVLENGRYPEHFTMPDTTYVRKLRPRHTLGEVGSVEWFTSCDEAFRAAMAAIGGRP